MGRNQKQQDLRNLSEVESRIGKKMTAFLIGKEIPRISMWERTEEFFSRERMIPRSNAESSRLSAVSAIVRQVNDDVALVSWLLGDNSALGKSPARAIREACPLELDPIIKLAGEFFHEKINASPRQK